MGTKPLIATAACIAAAVVACRLPPSLGGDSIAAAAIRELLERGDYQSAELAARRQFEEVRRTAGEQSFEAAGSVDLLVEALLDNGRGSSEEANRLAAFALSRKEALLGTDSMDLVRSLRNLARVKGDRAEAGAVEYLQRAVAIQEAGSAANPASLASTLRHLSLAFIRENRIDEAVKTAERAASYGAGVDAREQARCYEALVRALQYQGDYEKAAVQMSRALELRRPRDELHPEFADTLSLLSYQEYFKGRLDEALRAATLGAATAERTLRPDHPAVARALRVQAEATRDVWDLDRAREVLERALSMAERSLGTSHPEIADYLNNLANLRLLVGDYESARALYSRSLAIREAAYSRREEVATVANNLAETDASLGDFERSREEYQRALTIWEDVYGDGHFILAQALAGQAGAIRSLGQPADALPLFERALAIQRQRLGPQHPSVAVTLKEIATTLRQLHRDDESRQRIDEALRIWNTLRLPADREQASSLALLAEIHAASGDLDAALATYARALTMFEQVSGPSHPGLAQVRMGEARALAQTAQKSRALERAGQAEQAGREHLRLMLRSLPERQALSYAMTRPRGVDLMLSLVGATPEATPAAIDAVIRSRALVLDEVAARRRATSALAASTASARVSSYLAAEQRFANLLVQGPGEMPRQRYDEMLETARRQNEAAERDLAASSVEFRQTQSLVQAGLAEVMKALPEGAAMVSYVRFDPQLIASRRPGATAAPQASSPAYMAFVLRPGRAPLAARLGSAAEIDARISSWRQAIATEVLERRVTHPASDEIGRELRRRVWDPLAEHVVSARVLMVVADGALSLLPLAALPSSPGRYLIEDAPAIHYLTAERDVASRDAPSSASLGLLAIGGATFDDAPTAPASLRGAATNCGSLQSTVFGPLDGTREEVLEVARLWPTPRGAPQTYVGTEASEPLLKREAPRHKVLHIATHGFFLGGPCIPATSSNTRGVGGLSSAAEPGTSLRLSGLALAGANRRAQTKPDEDDGILTAEEVAMLDLHGVEWAVLSACDTGVGEIRAGEGVFGLRRAFQVAGARTVIMSLWSVEDQATRAWMRALYEGRFQRGLATADAVHQASLTVLRDRRARGQSTLPFFWAAFVAAGDWR